MYIGYSIEKHPNIENCEMLVLFLKGVLEEAVPEVFIAVARILNNVIQREAPKCVKPKS